MTHALNTLTFQNITADHAAELLTLRDLQECHTLTRAGQGHYALAELTVAQYTALLVRVITGADALLDNLAREYTAAALQQGAEDLLQRAQSLQDAVHAWQDERARQAAHTAELLKAQEILAQWVEPATEEPLP